jgi:acyl-coenzyme A thioesterase PaaI-like protein
MRKTAAQLATMAVEIDAVTVDDGTARFPFTVTAAASNDHGTLHASSACWFISLMNFLHDTSSGTFVMVGASFTYLRGMPTGRRGVAALREVKRGRSLTFYDMQLVDATDADVLYVTATAQFATPRLAKL